MVISLKEVIDEPLVSRAVILVVVAFLITVVVYGVVAGIVKMDDVGLSLTQRSEEHTSELQSLMRISYAVFCLKKKKTIHPTATKHDNNTPSRLLQQQKTKTH